MLRVSRVLAPVAVGTLSIFGCAIHTNFQGPGNTTVTVNGKNMTTTVGKNEATETVQKRFLAAQVGSVSADTERGNIEVRAATDGSSEIQVQATKSIHGDDPEETLKTLLPSVSVSAELKGTALVLTSDYPEEYKKKNVSVAVHYLITVPSRLGVDLKTSSGDIKLNGVQGGAKVSTEYGSIDVRGAAGTLEVETSSGAITIADAAGANKIFAKTRYGNISIERAGGEIEAETNSGSITVSDVHSATGLTLKSEYGNVELTNAAGKIHATTNSGQVKVNEATVIDSLTLHSDYGNVEANAIVGVGGASLLKVELTTSSGSVLYSGEASDLTLKSAYGGVSGKLTGKIGLKSANVTSSSGSAELTLPQNISATVRTATASGQVDVPGGLVCTNSNEDGTDKTVLVGGGAAKVKISSEYGNATFHQE